MKKEFFCLMVLVCMVSLVFGQNKRAPKIIFINDHCNFDTIPKGKKVTCRIEFTNKGKDPLLIKNITPACGCTVASYSKEPLKKNKKGFIEITYNASSKGAFYKTLAVETNSISPYYMVYVKGYVMDNSW